MEALYPPQLGAGFTMASSAFLTLAGIVIALVVIYEKATILGKWCIVLLLVSMLTGSVTLVWSLTFTRYPTDQYFTYVVGFLIAQHVTVFVPIVLLVVKFFIPNK